jgi:hypothetical protein
MKRKFRATEVSGFFYADKRQHGQYKHCNYICVNCHAVGRFRKHYPSCKNKETYAIPSTAEVPKRHSSRRKWDIFKKQFVYARPLGYWFAIQGSYAFRKGINNANWEV